MIAGIFIRNIKCYKGINFIPLTNDLSEKMSVMLGGNGAGKSTILEAINNILNAIDGKQWEITVNEKKDRALICPVFLIEKEKLSHDKRLTTISNKFWNDDFSSLFSHGSYVKDFVDWRNNLKKTVTQDKHLLIAIGKNSKNDVLLTSTFHQKFADLKVLGMSRQYFQDLFHEVVNLYSYVYIPIENKITDVLSLQASEMQGLMDKSVSDEIKVLLEKNHIDAGQNNKKSLMDLINTNLSDYIDDINERLSEGYNFRPKGSKKKIWSSDILKLVIQEYFNIRPLSKDGKSLSSLSSGQQRLALIDVATTLLSSGVEKSKDIIVAIDEPESSLESAQRYKQFSRLVELSEMYGHQIMLTTHWYGLLVKPTQGSLIHIENKLELPDVRTYSLQRLFDMRRHFPQNIEMKSYFDFMSSMLSILKNSDEKWLICEGSDDASYLQAYLKNRVNNLNIVPFNGCGNIKKLFDLLSVPFSDTQEQNEIKGKVLCLIDTDTKNLITIQGYKPSRFGNKLAFNRILFDRDNNKTKLNSVANTDGTNTEIEDVIEAKAAAKSVLDLAVKLEKSGDNQLILLLDHFKIDNNAQYANLSKCSGVFKPKNLEGHEGKPQLVEIINKEENKAQLSVIFKKYMDPDLPTDFGWLNDIENFFK
ncbi:AAA family ATPase [Pseudoalteromonas sp. SR44-5]|uniref:AAA family ATPase n=1 Tax=unclassified Pseudoalteromonas TaxID=194690 RepID=UPI00160326DE|nr:MULTISPECIES: AAA family ATPase [unclassified Pseudoalteromonas]MBB1366423.1 AAA family ATPase [Pseudoalteromonas sp. SR44-5]MBB1421115.1 AAA family ATPase [Pseudoalteromonas sp. SG43-7]